MILPLLDDGRERVFRHEDNMAHRSTSQDRSVARKIFDITFFPSNKPRNLRTYHKVYLRIQHLKPHGKRLLPIDENSSVLTLLTFRPNACKLAYMGSFGVRAMFGSALTTKWFF